MKGISKIAKLMEKEVILTLFKIMNIQAIGAVTNLTEGENRNSAMVHITKENSKME